jgi:hypothetical protein
MSHKEQKYHSYQIITRASHFAGLPGNAPDWELLPHTYLLYSHKLAFLFSSYHQHKLCWHIDQDYPYIIICFMALAQITAPIMPNDQRLKMSSR